MWVNFKTNGLNQVAVIVAILKFFLADQPLDETGELTLYMLFDDLIELTKNTTGLAG